MDTVDFVLVCGFMGLGIGLDVAIATFAMGGSLRENSVATTWISGVTTTHTLFPMLGFLLTFFGVKLMPTLMPILGVCAFAMIAYFIHQSLLEMTDDDESAVGTGSVLSLSLILAVSWDALWSGPAKSAQVYNWDTIMVVLSFFVVGFIVFLCALVGLMSFNLMARSVLRRPSYRFYFMSLWLQYSVIAYFGLLALTRYTFAWDISALGVFGISGFAVFLLMSPYLSQNSASGRSLSLP